MASLLDVAADLIDAMFNWFVVDLIIGTLEGFRDSLVDLFTANIMGIPGPVVAFMIIFALGMVIALNRWSR